MSLLSFISVRLRYQPFGESSPGAWQSTRAISKDAYRSRARPVLQRIGKLGIGNGAGNGKSADGQA